MKKGSKTPSKNTLKKDRENIKNSLIKKEYEKAKELSYKFIEIYPNNIFGYISCIEAITNDYSKFINSEDLKEVKEIYNNAISLASKSVKNELKSKFDDYLYDLKEVENLKKIKVELISKILLKNINNNAIALINQNINIINTYDKKGIKIKDGYDFIRGLFFLICLIFNIINPNILLVLTGPFGLYGLITMYSFIESNFLKKGKYKLEKEEYDNILKIVNEKINSIKQEITKIEENIEFLYNQKNSSILKIPSNFSLDIKDTIQNDEEESAEELIELLSSNDIVTFNILLNEKTNLESEDITKILDISFEDEKYAEFLNNKILERKNNQNKALLMRKIKKVNYVYLVILILLSILSWCMIIKDFYDLNLISFILAVITGFLTTLFYNINAGKHSNITEAFNDNLFNTVFNATLVYNLVYESITNNLSFMYCCVQMPIIFILIFIGFVKIISLLKYSYLIKRLRK